MDLDQETCYQALLARDTRFDGVFFTGVSSTGIYCRPVCPAKTPRQQNCTFYPSAAAAERAGYRPCLRCRPELAPGRAPIDAGERLAHTAALRIEEGALAEIGLEGLAANLGVSGRHLRRVMEAAYGVSPIELAQTQRLLLAKRLLTDTSLPVTDIVFASGFASVRRFNALFQSRYRLTPSALRRTGAAQADAQPPAETITCDLAFRPPLDWPYLLAFLTHRCCRGVEALADGRYVRSVSIRERRGWAAVSPSPRGNALRIEISAGLAPVLRTVLARFRALFDLWADPCVIAARLGPLAQANPGVRVPGAFDGFEMAVRAILGQQVTVRAAATMAGRIAAAFGEPITTPYEAITHIFPSPEKIAACTQEDLGLLGIIRSRSGAILALAAALASGDIALQPGRNVEQTIEKLRALPGIGDWTAQYIAMRALAWPDAFPHTDLGVLKALQETSPRAVLQRAEEWRPWRAYAVMHLWRSLEIPPAGSEN